MTVRMVDIFKVGNTSYQECIKHYKVSVHEYHGCTYYTDHRSKRRLHLCKLSDWDKANEAFNSLAEELNLP